MKPLGTALATSFGIGTTMFVVVYSLFHEANLAAGAAAIPIAGCPHIAEMMERRAARQSLGAHRATGIPSLAGFAIPSPLLLAYATTALLGVGLLATTVGVLAMMLPYGPEATFTPTLAIGVMLVAAPIELFGGFMVGRWIGTRCTRRPGLTVVLVAALASLALGGLGALIEWLAPAGSPPVLGQTHLQEGLIESLVAFCNLALAGLLGSRRGRARRMAEYMSYLLSVLPPHTRGVLVELAYEEARKEGTRLAAQ